MKKIFILLLLISSFVNIYSVDYIEKKSMTKDERLKAIDKLKKKLEPFSDKIEYKSGKIHKITSFDKTYDILSYSENGNIEKIDSYYSNGTLKTRAVFYRDSQTGEVLSIKREDSGTYFFTIDDKQKSYVKSRGESADKYDIFFSTLTLSPEKDDEMEYEYTEDGGLIVKKKDIITQYDAQGKLIRDGNLHYYYTEDKKIDRIEKKDENGNKEEVKFYTSGKPSYLETYTNGKITKKMIYKSTGNIEEYFENEKKYAQAEFDLSGKKVVKIEYFD